MQKKYTTAGCGGCDKYELWLRGTKYHDYWQHTNRSSVTIDEQQTIDGKLVFRPFS